MKNEAYPKKKPKGEPGQPSINRTMEVKKADQAGAPVKIPPLLPRAVIKAGAANLFCN